MKKWLRKLCGLRGQTTTEYAIIVALIAVSSIAVIMIFGNQIRALFGAEAQRLNSDTSVDVQNQTQGVDQATKGSIKSF